MVRLGWNATACEKKSIRDSIQAIKARQLYITADSTNLIKEMKNYSWKKNNDGTLTDEPVSFMDDAIAALRYACHSWINLQKLTWVAF